MERRVDARLTKGPADEILDHIMPAREIAAQTRDVFLTYLLDMILFEIVQRAVQAEGSR